jgi:hypothetical protein
MGLFVQDEMRRQVPEMILRFGEHRPPAVQDEFDSGP